MTTGLLKKIEERLRNGETCYSIGKDLGMSASNVCYWRDKLGIKSGPPSRRPSMLTIRNAHTGAVLAQGTAKECAQKMGLSNAYIQSLKCKIENGEITKYTVEQN